MKRKRLLLIGPATHLAGGIATVTRVLLSSDLVERYEVCFLNPTMGYPRKSGLSYNDLSKIQKGFLAIAAFAKFLIVCCFKTPDFILILSSHYGDFWRNSVFLLTSKLFSKRLFLWIHGSKFDEFCQKSSKPLLLIIRKILDLPDLVFVLSEHWVRFLSNYVPRTRLRILYNPIISADFNGGNAISREFEDLRDAKVILFVGNSDARDLKRKGVYDILSSVPLLKSADKDFLFVFAGPQNNANLVALCKKNQIDRNVLFCGSIPSDKLRELYSLAKIFLLPSYAEGLPLGILEAMAAGLPIISTPVGGIPELVEDGINGFLVKTGDIEAIAEKTRLLLGNGKLRNKMAKNNIEKVREKFDIEVILNQLEHDFNSVATNGRIPGCQELS